MEPDHLEQLRRLVPLRDLPDAERERLGVAREGLGRPRRIEPRPERDEYHYRLAELRTKAESVDPVVAASANPPGDLAVFEAALRQIAVESAAIKFERVEAERQGREVGSLCSRRIDGLVRISSLVCERRRHEPDRLDVRGDKFQKLVTYFMEFLREAAEETLGPDAEKFLQVYAVKMAGWEDRVDT